MSELRFLFVVSLDGGEASIYVQRGFLLHVRR
jgi:hypothetical protein